MVVQEKLQKIKTVSAKLYLMKNSELYFKSVHPMDNIFTIRKLEAG